MVRFRGRRHKGLVRPTSWSLWSLPRHIVCYVLVVDVLALIITALLLVTNPPAGRDLVMAAAIIGLGLVNGEISRHVERMRRRFSDTPHVNLTSIWTVAAALVLSPGLAAAVVAALYLHLWIRSWYRVRGVHAYRLTFSAATIVLACHAATGIQQLLGPESLVKAEFPAALWGIPLAVAAFSAVNTGLIAGAIALSERTLKPVRILGSWHANALEFATICLGALAAILLAWKPLLVALFVPALHVLHRSLLIRQFEQAAATDTKTGLLNAAAWHTVITKEYDRAKREGTSLGVLMIDLDHFKQVNDGYGHLAGDQALEAVANALRAEIRRYDVAGRFGGEEFVVGLPEVGDKEIIEIGERICERIRTLRVPVNGNDVVTGLTVSIGAACYPATRGGLDQLLLAADLAAFGAKDAGRDQVVVSRPQARGRDAAERTSARPGGPEPT
ncbi:diguanylate cyclase [Kibdelosporangium persicum]|uniref:Diguanylate cyclase n=1 Tax=Kibdelosporangium persicum TaxID=2698649 RepID=A0ABX2F138_9PSEU|nr:Diguanylate cyclase [Kibdelosporangium persicum]